jgi:hypothetical protein
MRHDTEMRHVESIPSELLHCRFGIPVLGKDGAYSVVEDFFCAIRLSYKK